MDKPPLSIWLPSYVIEYALIPSTIKHIPSKKIWAGNRWLGAVPRLAISKDYYSGEFHLDHCDDEWQSLSSVESRTDIEEIKIIAEKHYPGISDSWIKTGYKESDAKIERNIIVKDNACSFCNKSIDDMDSEITSMVGINEPRICNICILEFHNGIINENT